MSTIIKMSKTVYFDMDGTIADLYGVENWLDDLRAERVRPYAEAKPIYPKQELDKVVKVLIKKGYKIGVISWLSKTGTPEYNKRVRAIKKEWLSKNFPFAEEIHIVKYGTPKYRVAKNIGILVDDEEKNLRQWKLGETIDARQNLLQTLEQL